MDTLTDHSDIQWKLQREHVQQHTKDHIDEKPVMKNQSNGVLT